MGGVTQDKKPTSQPKSGLVGECPDVKMNGCSIPFAIDTGHVTKSKHAQ